MHKKTALKKTQGCPQNIPVRVLERILPQRHRAAASYRLPVPLLERSQVHQHQAFALLLRMQQQQPQLQARSC